MDYRKERGLVGEWKKYKVYVIDKESYDIMSRNEPDAIMVIANDGMRMVLNGKVIGVLSAQGSVTEVPHVAYKNIEEKPKVSSAVGKKRETKEFREEFELPSAVIEEGYFEQFTGEVDKFFAAFDKAE